jgi:ribosomal protein S18 acetylase RimI-like enzyme
MTIRRISTKKEKLVFVRMMWDIYDGDPYWVPPLEMDRLKLIDEIKNPFYKHSEVAFFVAEDNGKIIGRIAGIVNHNYNKFQGDKTGFFGFFECINDNVVASALLKEAEEFVRSKGMVSIQGPFNPSSNDESGLLINGFDSPPVLLMTYNPRYYIDLIERAGYMKAMDLYAWRLTTGSAKSEKLMRVTSRLQERKGVTIRSFNAKDFKGEVERIKRMYNSAWEKNWGFVPLNDEEFDFLANDLKQIYDPDIILFAEKNGEPIGFSLSLPNINESLTAGLKIPKGVMNLPATAWNLLTKKKKITGVRILTLGVLKEHRGLGIDGMLYAETIKRAEAKGYSWGEASWILENNDPMNRALEMMNGEKYKTYRIYEKPL